MISSSEDEEEVRRPPPPLSHILIPDQPTGTVGRGAATFRRTVSTSSGTRPASAVSSTSRQLQGIKCLYTDNVNIAKVATDVIAHLKRLSSPAEAEHLKRDIETRKKELEDELWTYTQYHRRLDEIKRLEKQYSELGTLEARYRAAIEPAVQRWSLCTKTPDVCHLSEIDECINLFAKATSEFVPMAAVKIHSSASDLCFVCGKVGTLIESVGSSGQLYCKECKSGRQVLSATNGRDMKGDDSSAGEDDATETDRIELILKRFQGKQPPLPQGVLDSIESYLNSRTVLKQSEIRELITKNPSCRYDTSRALLQEAMRATHNERAYKDINAVAAAIWGWELPVLTQDFENLIIADYRMTQAYYPVIRGGRRSRLNADYRLMRHLTTRGFWHPILNEISVQSTSEVLEYHSNAWEQMCRLSGLPLVQMNM